LRRLRVNWLTVSIVHDASLFTLFQRLCLLLQWLLNRLLRDGLLHWLLSRLLLSRGSLLFLHGCGLRLCLRLRLGHNRLLLHGHLRLLQRLRLGHWSLSLSYGNWRLTLNLSTNFLILSLGLGYHRLLLVLWLSPATLLLMVWLMNHRLLLGLGHLRLGLGLLLLQGLWLSLLTLNQRLLLGLGCLWLGLRLLGMSLLTFLLLLLRLLNNRLLARLSRRCLARRLRNHHLVLTIKEFLLLNIVFFLFIISEWSVND